MKKIIVAFFIACASLVSVSAVAAESTSYSQKAPKGEVVVFKVAMHCHNCAKKISENIAFEKGVKDLKVDLENKTVTITYDPKKTNKETLAAAIQKLGYSVSEVE